MNELEKCFYSITYNLLLNSNNYNIDYFTICKNVNIVEKHLGVLNNTVNFNLIREELARNILLS